jgi:hypothetical protein
MVKPTSFHTLAKVYISAKNNEISKLTFAKKISLKQILYITEHNPFGFANGAQQRSNLIFRALQKAGHVHLFCISEELPPEVHNTITPFAARGGDQFLSQR